MSADDLFSEGNDAFVDDDYNHAVEKYTAAIELNSHYAKYYTQRAAAYIKLGKYQDAIADASSATTLEPRNAKAYLRKGVAFFHQNKFDSAKEALEKSLELDGSKETKNWIEKCEAHLNQKRGEEIDTKEPESGEVTTDTPNTTLPVEPALPKVIAKPRYDWYQTDARVVVTILVKNRTMDDVKCDINERSLSVCVRLEDGSDYTLSLDLAHSIVASQSKFKVLATKIEVQLKKAELVRWSSLEGRSKTQFAEFPSSSKTDQSVASTQMYPTSSHVHRNWDKLAADIEKEEKDEKLEGDAALNQLFQKIYGEGSDDVKRAMNKSFVESGGTVLSTNWGEVGKKKVECKPPDGMEFKKY